MSLFVLLLDSPLLVFLRYRIREFRCLFRILGQHLNLDQVGAPPGLGAGHVTEHPVGRGLGGQSPTFHQIQLLDHTVEILPTANDLELCLEVSLRSKHVVNLKHSHVMLLQPDLHQYHSLKLTRHDVGEHARHQQNEQKSQKDYAPAIPENLPVIKSMELELRIVGFHDAARRGLKFHIFHIFGYDDALVITIPRPRVCHFDL